MQKLGPAQQMHPQLGKKVAMSPDPAGSLQHLQGPLHEVLRRWGGGESHQGCAQPLRLGAKAADPELAAPVAQARKRGCFSRLGQGAAFQQSCSQKQSDHRETEAEIRQGESGQERNGALTEKAQIAADTNYTVKGLIDQSTAVEAMRLERILALAKRTVVRSITIRMQNHFLA